MTDTITVSRAVLEQALYVLNHYSKQARPISETALAITALRAALANAEQAQPQGDRAVLVAKLRGSVYTTLRPDQLNMIAADMLEADHIPDAGKMMHCERCGAELMSDMTTICYQCNQD